MSITVTAPADPYERLAPAYHLLSSESVYEVWLDNLLRAGQGAGIEVSTVLDVACGTGSSALPIVRRGLAVTATDRSPAMLAIAGTRLGPETRLVTADMCELARLGEFDLVTCLDDSLNHLLSLEQLEAALRRMHDNLARAAASSSISTRFPRCERPFHATGSSRTTRRSSCGTGLALARWHRVG
jgi:2-polyprenyl-3-methyl-5-hydroxy-6-metoxy-1,4-benzoquinol methylase